MPIISREAQRQRELQAQRKREAEEAIAPWKFRKVELRKVEPFKYELFGVEVSRDAQMLWQHLDRGQEHISHGAPVEQTDEQLAETCSLVTSTAGHVAAVLDELIEKRLIRIEERRGKRFVSTTTARTCGLG